ncbi:magnesium chelatase [Streptomyces sp. NBC_01615]|uniref:magnesium chelatase n=1 Tax=Streptomyces sp. NBC_01615 TaxID=2975898 RepID=UPI0038641EB1
MPIEPPSRRDADAASAPPEEPEDLARRLVRALACSAVDPALSGVLLFDLDPQLVDPVARVFAELLGGPSGRRATPVMLGADSRDEGMWTRPVLRQERDGITFAIEPGPLLGAEDPGAAPPLLVVPDLARLSVAGMRAAVQLLGADVAVVEQTGLRRTSRPLARWLAVCRSADAGRLSTHLLDRFAIRIPAAGLRLPADGLGTGALPHAWPAAAGAPGAPAVRAVVTDDAVRRVRELLDPDTGNRRTLSLLRLARALATLDGEPDATPEHCDAAARLIGLPAPQPTERTPTDSGPAHPPVAPSPPDPDPHRDARDRTGRGGTRRFESTTEQLLETEPAEGIGGVPGLDESTSPYAEDEAVPLRDFAPLRNPWQRTAGPASTRGVVVGTQRARDLRDLAYVRTAREAAVHQRIRHHEGFTVSPVDLHSNVRAASPERMLVLVLDHTCRGDWDWQDTLTPFLQWAYAGRAAAQVIEVGSATAKDELRAESFAARSVLDPRIVDALYRPAGRATPLAHGLEQARQALLRAFRQHGNGLVEVWLAVITDGRGNVPLRASHTGQLQGPVGAEGVEDAFKAATRFSTMDRTRLNVAVVDAARRPYEHLPFRLADKLGGTVVEGRLAEERGTREDGGRGEG